MFISGLTSAYVTFSAKIKYEMRVSTLMRDNGRFHTRRRTNRLDGQMVSDEQIV